MKISSIFVASLENMNFMNQIENTINWIEKHI